ILQLFTLIYTSLHIKNFFQRRRNVECRAGDNPAAEATIRDRLSLDSPVYPGISRSPVVWCPSGRTRFLSASTSSFPCQVVFLRSGMARNFSQKSYILQQARERLPFSHISRFSRATLPICVHLRSSAVKFLN